jgi:hypothetical protein
MLDEILDDDELEFKPENLHLRNWWEQDLKKQLW